MVKNENYYTIFGWMLNELKLSGIDLIVYAIIYSFSQDGESEFKGSVAYISDFTGGSTKTIRRSLIRLEEMGYIAKCERNQSAGSANSYRSIVDLDLLLRGVGQNDRPSPPGGGGLVKMTTPVGQNDQGVGQNDHPIKNTSISTAYKEERKKEKEIYKEKEGADEEFAQMTDEELLRWGERSCDLNDPAQETAFYAWCNECRKRRETTKRWKGKIIKNDHVFEILKSHEEVMDEMGVNDNLKDVLKQFLRNAYLNKHLISNDKLVDIICRLNEYYEHDEDGKIRSVCKAIEGGWYDIRELKR